MRAHLCRTRLNIILGSTLERSGFVVSAAFVSASAASVVVSAAFSCVCVCFDPHAVAITAVMQSAADSKTCFFMIKSSSSDLICAPGFFFYMCSRNHLLFRYLPRRHLPGYSGDFPVYSHLLYCIRTIPRLFFHDNKQILKKWLFFR